MARHRAASTAPSLPTRLGIKSAADVRALIYNSLPVVTTMLVGLGVATSDQAAMWAGLLSAVAGPGLAWWMARSVSSLRTALYAILTAAQALLVGYGLYAGAGGVWLPLVSAVLAMLGGGLAVANTPVTSAWTRNVNGEADPSAPVVE